MKGVQNEKLRQTKEGIKTMIGKFLKAIFLKTYAQYSKIIRSVVNQATKEDKISGKSVKLLRRMNNA